jgi:hypothetical protein
MTFDLLNRIGANVDLTGRILGPNATPRRVELLDQEWRI